MAAPKAPRSRWRWIAAAAGVLALTALGTRAWLLRDPVPYWDARRGTLAAVELGEIRLDGRTEEQDIRVVGSSGLGIELAIRRPMAPDSATRRPLFLVLGGHERGKGAAALIGDTRGAIFASLQYPYDGDHQAKGLAVVLQVPKIRRALYDTPRRCTSRSTICSRVPMWIRTRRADRREFRCALRDHRHRARPACHAPLAGARRRRRPRDD